MTVHGRTVYGSSMKLLDPAYWRKVPSGFSQQNGRARLVRRRVGSRIVCWELYLDDQLHDSWSNLRAAKQSAALIKFRRDQPGYCNLGGGGTFAPMGTCR